jgi:hypothetical protein
MAGSASDGTRITEDGGALVAIDMAIDMDIIEDMVTDTEMATGTVMPQVEGPGMWLLTDHRPENQDQVIYTGTDRMALEILVFDPQLDLQIRDHPRGQLLDQAHDLLHQKCVHQHDQVPALPHRKRDRLPDHQLNPGQEKTMYIPIGMGIFIAEIIMATGKSETMDNGTTGPGKPPLLKTSIETFKIEIMEVRGRIVTRTEADNSRHLDRDPVEAEDDNNSTS